MLFQKKEEPRKPKLMGEDFDVFPDLGQGHTYQSDAARQEAAAPEAGAPADADAHEEAEPSPFEKKMAAYSEAAWKKLQIIGGALLGLLSGLSLTVLNEIQEFSAFSLILAVVFALLVPNLFERSANRKIPTARIALIVALALWLGAHVLYRLVLNPAAA